MYIIYIHIIIDQLIVAFGREHWRARLLCRSSLGILRRSFGWAVGVISFQCLTLEFCNLLVEEILNYQAPSAPSGDLERHCGPGFPEILPPLRSIADAKAGGFPQRPPNSMHPGCQCWIKFDSRCADLVNHNCFSARQAVVFSDPDWKVDDIIYILLLSDYPTHF